MRIEGQSPGGGGTTQALFRSSSYVSLSALLPGWDGQTSGGGGSGPQERAHPWGLWNTPTSKDHVKPQQVREPALEPTVPGVPVGGIEATADGQTSGEQSCPGYAEGTQQKRVSHIQPEAGPAVPESQKPLESQVGAQPPALCSPAPETACGSWPTPPGLLLILRSEILLTCRAPAPLADNHFPSPVPPLNEPLNSTS